MDISNDAIDRFLTASSKDRLAMVKRGEAENLRTYLGPEVFGDYERLAARWSEHLSGRSPNLIFVPGIMGSLLKSDGLGGVWWIDVRTRQHLDDLRLSPDGTEDANPKHKVVPCTTDPSYEGFLTAVLEQDAFAHEVHPYDWRKPLAASAAGLRDHILRMNERNGGDAVHLVAHSMGGLLVRATLARFGDELWPKLGKVVFLATPHYGSQAIGGYLKNHFWGFEMMSVLGRYLGRETFRSLWGALSLLPAPRGIYPGTRESDAPQWSSGDPKDPYPHPCCNFDLYQAEAWELGLKPEETKRLQAVLDAASAFHRELYLHHSKLPQELRDRMLMIAGVGYKSLFRLAWKDRLFGLWEHMDKVTSREPGNAHRDGDGRVPVASSSLEDVTLRFVKGIHAGVPNIPAVYKDVFRWLAGKKLELPDTPQGALSQHLSIEETSAAPHLDGTSRASTTDDDPGYWSGEDLTPETAREYEGRLERGEVPGFVMTRMM